MKAQEETELQKQLSEAIQTVKSQNIVKNLVEKAKENKQQIDEEDSMQQKIQAEEDAKAKEAEEQRKANKTLLTEEVTKQARDLAQQDIE